MDPYQVLGAERSWTLDQIEVRYRALVLQHHPDLHRQEGTEAVARAEMQTRRLNEAMKRLREQHPVVGCTPRESRPAGARLDDENWMRGPRGDDFGIRVDWPPRPDEEDAARAAPREQPCPFCAEEFTELPLFGLHLIEVHGMDFRVHRWQRKKKRKAGIVRGPKFSSAERFIELAALAAFVAMIPVFLWYRTAVNGLTSTLLDSLIFTFVGLGAVIGFRLLVSRGRK
ncbi:MAG: J domain-containing protein [Actinobacteria bacterium]|nr:J domain-containing protein [Actinomycetota bacterium]